MISESKLLWDSRWPTLELKLFTSVREILGITLQQDKMIPCWFTCPIRRAKRCVDAKINTLESEGKCSPSHGKVNLRGP